MAMPLVYSSGCAAQRNALRGREGEREGERTEGRSGEEVERCTCAIDVRKRHLYRD